MNYASVTIVTKADNRTLFLDRAIRSVLAQTYYDWQHVIIANGSNYNAILRIINSYKEAYQGRLVVINNPSLIGRDTASNIGIRETSSEYLVIHDDFNSWEPTFLERCLAFMDDSTKPRLKSDYGGVITYTMHFIEKIEENTIYRISSKPLNSWMTSVSLYELAASNTFPQISFLFKRDAIERVGYFREDLPFAGAWDFNWRVCLNYEIGLIPEFLANYHNEADSKDEIYRHINMDTKQHENSLYKILLSTDSEQAEEKLKSIPRMEKSLQCVHMQIAGIKNLLKNLRDR